MSTYTYVYVHIYIYIYICSCVSDYVARLSAELSACHGLGKGPLYVLKPIRT